MRHRRDAHDRADEELIEGEQQGADEVRDGDPAAIAEQGARFPPVKSPDRERSFESIDDTQHDNHARSLRDHRCGDHGGQRRTDGHGHNRGSDLSEAHAQDLKHIGEQKPLAALERANADPRNERQGKKRRDPRKGPRNFRPQGVWD